jgi:hypothetical protein
MDGEGPSCSMPGDMKNLNPSHPEIEMNPLPKDQASDSNYYTIAGIKIAGREGLGFIWFDTAVTLA